MEHLDSLLLRGEVVKTITYRGKTWSAILCKGNPEYLADMKACGAYHEMFSTSPGEQFHPFETPLTRIKLFNKNTRTLHTLPHLPSHMSEFIYRSTVPQMQLCPGYSAQKN